MDEDSDRNEREELHAVLSSIRARVRRETRSRAQEGAPSPATAPRKRLILGPEMRVRAGHRCEGATGRGADAGFPPFQGEVLGQDRHIPHAPPIDPAESFAIANPAIDEEMLRDIVRDVVREQMRGEMGRELLQAMKRDLIRALEQY